MEHTTVINSVIGEGTFYNGSIDAVDILRIDGSFVGIARSRDVILVGMNGRVKGTLSSSRIIITGMIDGTIQNTELVIIQSSSAVLGIIEAENIIIESSAAISANLRSARIRYIPNGFIRDSVSDILADGKSAGKSKKSERHTLPSETGHDDAFMEMPLVRIIERFSNKTLERMFSE